jgi:hypothetical protein
MTRIFATVDRWRNEDDAGRASSLAGDQAQVMRLDLCGPGGPDPPLLHPHRDPRDAPIGVQHGQIIKSRCVRPP